MKIKEKRNAWYLVDSEGGIIFKIVKQSSMILRADGFPASETEKKKVIPIMFKYIEDEYKRMNPILARSL